ncbi:autotransporter domain-containing protein [Erythrobacter oryzae]|uniref:autotransporter domain-containing protein n=1 Tax=Erythrobacter oryzae TaxID=3019556 RepID=UPI002555BDF2|nr:autotransporter domain-containing protein [Erythrobacter sp. COR-2]
MKTLSAPRRQFLAGSALAALAIAAVATPAHAVIPNETTNSEAIVDTNDQYRGVGMFFRADGFICSGTLINPRTVIFAAHCVNDLPEEAYNTDTEDGIPAAFSFNVNALPGFQNWFANNFQSNPNLAVYNISRIFYDQRSLQDPLGLGFIQADIALAALDTPAADIPTWALLFTTLPAPETIDPVTGTGYHVNMVGYGRTGNSVQGPRGGADFRRRAAENMLGGFFSLDDQNSVLFGPQETTFPQNLYQFDFDSQDRAPVRDINIHRDEALPNEGTTAGGDSGGPLILDAANNTLSNEDLVIGVLSGGSRFFGASQPFSSIGTTSFYQPLSLYWQYIAANNPYRYVGTVAGNGNWEDPTRWVTLLDPAYRVINAQGQVVNGLPTTPELGPNGTDGDFGQICVEFEAPGDGCVDQRTGEEIDTAPPQQDTRDVSNGREQVSLEVIGGEGATFNLAAVSNGEGTATTTGDPRAQLTSEVAPQAAAEGAVLPAPTLANGLPGATGFVANNVDAVTNGETRVDPRFFDVTLSQAGTTTLSSEVTIDRLTVRGQAGLTVAAAGDLTSLIDINQFGGVVNVNGNLASVGDYTLFAGMLGGTGTVTAPFLTSITGVFSPATMGTTGTLTIDGTLVMSSGTNFLVDLGSGATSDRLAVTGEANIGGVVSIGTGVTQRVNGQGQRYTILTAAEGVTGTFTARALSPLLSQNFIYQANAVLMEVNAASYNTVINANDPVQVAYARLFDQNRGNGALSTLYALDFASTDTIRSTFQQLAPVNEQAVRSLAAQSINLLQNLNDARLRESNRDSAGGKVAVTGRPLDLAQMGLAPGMQPLGGSALMAAQEGETEITETNLPDNVAVFLSGGHIFGDADSLPGYTAGTQPGGVFQADTTDYSGWYLSGGLEFFLGDNTMVGIAGHYVTLDADTPLSQQVENDTYGASLYMRQDFDSGLVIDGQVTLASVGFDTTRRVSFLGTPQTLESSTDNLLFTGALGVSYDLETSLGTISPGIEGRYASIDFDRVQETGGTLALSLDRQTYKSTQLRGGFDWEKQGKKVTFNANAQIVRELEQGPTVLGANFVAGTGAGANFVLGANDRTWGEVGISATLGNGPFQIGAAFDSTIARSDANAQVIRATASYKF